MIITRTPLRISLIGGGTDLPSFYKKAPGAVLSFAIDKYVYVILNKKFDGSYRIAYSRTEIVDSIEKIEHNLVRETLKLFSNIKHGLEITTVADIPGTGSGLGSSSAMTVGLLRALQPEEPPTILAERAFCVEAEACGAPVGKQDQYASAIGGMNFMIFGKNNVSVKPIVLPSRLMHDFENSSLLLWTGITRDANPILKDQRRRYDSGEAMTSGRKLAKLAHDFLEELAGAGRIKIMGEIMHQSWILKREMAEGISNPDIDNIYNAAMQAGAYGGKILGAGGGGFFFFLAPQYMHKKIIEATGLQKVDFKLEERGSEVVYGKQAENAVRG